ncbi:MAG: S9 family peptidase, partial [Myxococcota bacterium]
VKVAEGADFYMQPAWHPTGERLAWVEWNHPNMPWNGTVLRTAGVTVDAKGIHVGEVETWAGGDEVAIQQPVFSPDGSMLAYTSDASGYAEIYARELSSGQVRRLSSTECDHTSPAWVQGVRTIAWAPDGASVYALRNEAGVIRLVRYPLAGQPVLVPTPEVYEFFSQLTVHSDGSIAAVVSGSRQPGRLVKRDPSGSWSVIKRATPERLPPEHYAPMRPVSWFADDGSEVFGSYYPPTHPEVRGEGAPPALIMIHGGPTSQRTAAFESRNQFFATRGFAVLDVNYRGSTGYGRAYMNALFGKWGILDVEDAVGGAKFLVDEGLAEAGKISIMGGSAGGYTVLHSLAEHPGVFAAGLSLYGISNLFSLTEGTHKFESRYNDSLLGVLPEDAAIFRERSPIFKAERMEDPVAVFQGAEDKVVPKEQADQIVASLKGRGVPHVYHVYEGEGHGWRRAETIEHFYEAALAFLREHVLDPQK